MQENSILDVRLACKYFSEVILFLSSSSSLKAMRYTKSFALRFHLSLNFHRCLNIPLFENSQDITCDEEDLF